MDSARFLLNFNMESGVEKREPSVYKKTKENPEIRFMEKVRGLLLNAINW